MKRKPAEPPIERIGILISGRGSNMKAIVEASEAGKIPARVALVVSNEPDAAGIEWARARGLAVALLDHRAFPTRHEHERAVVSELDRRAVDLVCLAGYMRIASPWFVSRYPRRMLNIHPSLLPAFPGLHAQRQAIEYGVKISGATVHFVDEGVDHGPVILQQAVPVADGDSSESLAERILQTEHELYPEAVRLVCLGRLWLDGRRTRVEPA